jgi:hypothetical protein
LEVEIMRRNNAVYIVIVFVAVLSLGIVVYGVSGTTKLTYSGYVTDASGTPLNGVFSMDFNLYDVVSGGTALGTHSSSVSIADGYFSEELSFSSSFFDGRDLWLGVTVNPDLSEMTPRIKLTETPYATSLKFKVTDSEMADGAALAEILDDDGAESGLDADLLDGQDSTDFMSSDTDNWVDITGDTMTGKLDVDGGSTVGIVGRTMAGAHIAIQGLNFAQTGYAPGVAGLTYSTSGRGVFGRAFNDSGTTYGVYGAVNSPDGWGLYTPDNAKIEGNLEVGGFNLASGAGTDKVLTSDASGNGAWETPTDSDILGGLSCASGQVAKWNGAAWSCAADNTGAEDLDWTISGSDMYSGVSGKIGIGTTSPTTALSFGSGAVISRATIDTADNGVLKLAGGGLASSIRGAVIQLFGNEHASSPGQLYLAPGSTGDIYMNGNVGIGISSPGGKLDVASPGATDTPGDGHMLRFTSTGGTPLFGFRMDGTNDHLVLDNGWGPNWNPSLAIKRVNGYVGIGTASPSSVLDVVGDLEVSGDLIGGNHDHMGEVWYGDSYYGHWISNSRIDRPAIVGETTATSGHSIGVVGQALAGDGDAIGVKGSSEADYGTGVWGISFGDSGRGIVGSGKNYDFYAEGSGTDYGTASSIRWKDNITSIENALEKVQNIRGVYYDWDEEHGGQHDMGFIAEEVGEEIPEIVEYEEDGVFATGVDYGAITPVLVEAIKEQQTQIEQLKTIVCFDHPDEDICK